MKLTKQLMDSLLEAAKDGHTIGSAADLCCIPANVLNDWITRPTNDDEQRFSLDWKKTKAIRRGDRMRVLDAISNRKNRDSLNAIKMLNEMESEEKENNESGLDKLIDAIRNPLKGHTKEE